MVFDQVGPGVKVKMEKSQYNYWEIYQHLPALQQQHSSNYFPCRRVSKSDIRKYGGCHDMFQFMTTSSHQDLYIKGVCSHLTPWYLCPWGDMSVLLPSRQGKGHRESQCKSHCLNRNRKHSNSVENQGMSMLIMLI